MGAPRVHGDHVTAADISSLLVGVADASRDLVDVGEHPGLDRFCLDAGRSARKTAFVEQRHVDEDGRGLIRQLGRSMRGEKDIVARHADAVRHRRGLDIHVHVGVVVGVAANLQAAVGQMLVDEAFNRCLDETAARGLRTQIFDDKSDR